jgi:hypothetical protein
MVLCLASIPSSHFVVGVHGGSSPFTDQIEVKLVYRIPEDVFQMELHGSLRVEVSLGSIFAYCNFDVGGGQLFKMTTTMGFSSFYVQLHGNSGVFLPFLFKFTIILELAVYGGIGFVAINGLVGCSTCF